MVTCEQDSDLWLGCLCVLPEHPLCPSACSVLGSSQGPMPSPMAGPQTPAHHCAFLPEQAEILATAGVGVTMHALGPPPGRNPSFHLEP